jgi:transposase
MSTILAIDLGKFHSVTCLFDTGANTTEFWTMSTDRQYLATVLKKYAPDLVVIESCGLAGWVHDACTEQGYPVLVCNPNQEAWKWKNVKRKTDRDDALKLAKLAALGQLVPVYIPSKSQREYRRLVKYRQVLLGRMNRVQNNIRAIFVQRGMPMVRGQQAWTLGRFELLAQHRKPLVECTLDELWRGELDLELLALEQLQAQYFQIQKKLKALALADERVRLLQTIPGVGRKTAEVVVAYLDDARRFRNARQVSSYAGLVPRRYQSGEMDRHGHIHKHGPRQLRGALVEAAWMMLRYNRWARSVYERLTSGQKTRKKKAIVAVARKLLVRCWVMLLRKEPWRRETAASDAGCVAAVAV